MPEEITRNVQNLSPATRYIVRVRAYNQLGSFSNWSEAIDFRTVKGQGQVPEDPTVAPILTPSYGQILVAMTAPESISDLGGFLLETAPVPSGPWTVLIDTNGNSFAHIVDPGSTHSYRYKVRDFFGNYSVNYSPIATATATSYTGISNENLLKNSSFENGTTVATDWANYTNGGATATYGLDIGQKLYQDRSQKLTVTNGGTGIGVSQTVTLASGNIAANLPVSITFWVKQTDGSGRTATIECRNSANNAILATKTGPALVLGVWTRYVLQFKTAASYPGIICNFFMNSPVSADVYYFEGAQFQFSESPSDWAPPGLEIPDGFINSTYISSLLADRIISGVVSTALITLGTNPGDVQRIVTDGVTVAGSVKVTSNTANWIPTDRGKPLTAAGIPSFASVAKIYDSKTIDISYPATATATGVSITIPGGVGQIRSSNFVAGTSGFQILGTGHGEFSDLLVRNSVVVGTSITSTNFVTGVSGYQILGNGNAEFSNITIRGSAISSGEIVGSIITGPLFRTAISGNRLEIHNTSDALFFYNGDITEITPGFVNLVPSDFTPGNTIKDTLQFRGPNFSGAVTAAPYIALHSENSGSFPFARIDFQAYDMQTFATHNINFSSTNVLLSCSNEIRLDSVYLKTLAPVDTQGAGFVTRSGGHVFNFDWSSGAFQQYFAFIDATSIFSVDNQGGTVNFSFAGTPKTFVIDHPLDKTKYLVHACLEGPESAVYYRGKGKCINGKAEVMLPTYFEVATREEDRTVQLTPIMDSSNSFPQIASSGSIKNGRFTVYSNLPDTRFFWEVKALRSDTDLLVVEPNKKDVNVKGNGPYKYINGGSNAL